MCGVIYEVIYSDWFVYNMLEHLSAKDLYSLKMSTTFHYKEIKYKDIKNMIISTIIRRLQTTTNVKIDVLLKYMEKNKISISGSFILQCILNEFWEGSDIDMYTYKYLSLNKNVFIDSGYEVSAFTTEKDYIMLGDISTIGNFEIKDKPVLQLILLDNDKNIFTYINTSYDFNVCKNIFYIENGKYMLNMQHMHDIMNKQISCNFLGTSCKLSTRKLKYEERGFTFKNNVLGNYIYYNGHIVPIIMCYGENKQFNVFNRSFCINEIGKILGDDWYYTDTKYKYGKEDRITTSKFELKYKNLFLPEEIKHCNKVYETKCKADICNNCPIKCLDDSIKHYHSMIKKDRGHTPSWSDSIIIEYSDNDILKLHKQIHNGEKLDVKYRNLFMNFKKFCKKTWYPDCDERN